MSSSWTRLGKLEAPASPLPPSLPRPRFFNKALMLAGRASRGARMGTFRDANERTVRVCLTHRAPAICVSQFIIAAEIARPLYKGGGDIYPIVMLIL